MVLFYVLIVLAYSHIRISLVSDNIGIGPTPFVTTILLADKVPYK